MGILSKECRKKLFDRFIQEYNISYEYGKGLVSALDTIAEIEMNHRIEQIFNYEKKNDERNTIQESKK